LEGLEDSIEPSGLWSLLEEFSTEMYGKILIHLLPGILMRSPDCRIDAARSTELMPGRAGSILYMGLRLWIPMEFHGAVWRLISTPMQPA